MSHKLSAENNVHNETEIIKQAVFNANKIKTAVLLKISLRQHLVLPVCPGGSSNMTVSFFYIALILNR